MYDYDGFYGIAQDFVNTAGTRDGLSRDDFVFFNLCLLYLDEMDEEEPDLAVCDLLLETMNVFIRIDFISMN